MTNHSAIATDQGSLSSTTAMRPLEPTVLPEEESVQAASPVQGVALEPDVSLDHLMIRRRRR